MREFENRVINALIRVALPVYPPAALWLEHHRAVRGGCPEFKLLPALALKSKHSIDVGANVGVLSRILAKHSRGVTAIEPNPELCSRMRRSEPKNVTVVQCAVGEAPGVARLKIPVGASKHLLTGHASLLESAMTEFDEYVEIDTPIRTIDEMGLSNIEFIKIDVEGFETEVLRGALNVLRSERPNLMIESETRHNPEAPSCVIDMLEPMGYRAFFLKNRKLYSWADYDAVKNGGDLSNPNYVKDFFFVHVDRLAGMIARLRPVVAVDHLIKARAVG